MRRATWRQYAYSEPDVYVRFCNMMLNDGEGAITCWFTAPLAPALDSRPPLTSPITSDL